MARSERLLELIQVLRRHRRPVSGAVLAEELGVSLRTVYRDIQSLIAHVMRRRCRLEKHAQRAGGKCQEHHEQHRDALAVESGSRQMRPSVRSSETLRVMRRGVRSWKSDRVFGARANIAQS